MKRLLILVAAAMLGIAAAAPAVLAAEPAAHTGRVVLSTQGDVTIPANEQADTVIVIDGTANIQGTVNTVVVVEGSANLTGATVESVVAVRSNVEVGSGTVVSGQVMRLDSTVHQTGDAQIVGGVTDLSAKLVEFQAAIGPAMFLGWIGVALATLAAALLLAGLFGRQVRRADRLIATEPVQTFLIGLASVIVIPIAAILLIVTIVGAPLGVGILLGLLPLVAFVGYLVAATWLGDWLVSRMGTGPSTSSTAGSSSERPFLGAVVGVLLLQVLGLVPFLGLVVAVASLVGFGAVIRLGFATLRGTPTAAERASRPMRAPTPV